MRRRLLPVVLVAGTLAVATGAAVRVAEPANATDVPALGVGQDVTDAVVVGTIVRVRDLAPRDVEHRRDVALWTACSCALAAVGLWVLVRERVRRGASGRAPAVRQTRAPPVTATIVCR